VNKEKTLIKKTNDKDASMTKFERDRLNQKKLEIQRRESFSFIPQDLEDGGSPKAEVSEKQLKRERKKKYK
jgi:hypothetical protein